MNIKDYLHLYLGCQMLYSTHHEPQDEQYKLNSANLSEAIDFQDRPILRPLSDMTEEEAKEFCIKEGWGENLENIVVLDDCIEFNVARTKAIARFTRCRPQMFVWLLSKGFDLFGLIDAGLAIDKTKVEGVNNN